MPYSGRESLKISGFSVEQIGNGRETGTKKAPKREGINIASGCPLRPVRFS
jgi:hypothetical protein